MPPMKRQRRNYRNNPYKRKSSSSKPRALMSQAGVGGAANSMVPRPMPPPQEVKTFDTQLASVAVPSQAFVFVVPTLSSSIVGNIIPGTNSYNRIGRQIRVVGIVVRGLVVSTVPSFSSEGGSTCMDLIWDRQPNGNSPSISTVYNTGASSAGNLISCLPNADYQKRFTFIKRLQTTGRAGIPTATQIVDATIKTNRLVNYDAVSADVASVETNNLLVTFSSTVAASTFNGNIRILYVDA